MMKYKILTLILGVAFIAASCGEDEIDRPVIDTDNLTGEAPVFENSAEVSSVTFTAETTSDTFEVFSWSSALFNGTSVITTYTGEIATTEDFSDPLTLFTTTGTSQAVLKGDINASMLSLGLAPNENSTFYIRVTAIPENSIFEDSEVISSLALEREATSFFSVSGPIFLFGEATAAGSDNPADPITRHFPLFPDFSNPNIYSFTGKFEASGFKIVQTPGDADSYIWGKGDMDNALQINGETDFVIATEGYYTFTMNVSSNSFTLTEYDESTATDYTTEGIGITGAGAGGWDEFPTRYSLTQSTFDSHIWYATNVTFVADEFKLKQDSPGWGIQWGSGDETAWPSGKYAFNGGNAVAIPGTYTVFFNDLTGDYWMIEE